jgi:hemolysin activation/secretion protein
LNRTLAIVAITLAAGAMPDALRAQTSPLIIDQNRTDRNPQGAVPVPSPPPAAQAQPRAGAMTSFTLSEVRIEGTSLPPETLRRATQEFVGRTIDAPGLNAIADAVAAAYAESDIALYTVTVPQQDFAGGVLRLVVAEGHIERLQVEGDLPHGTALIAAYADKMTGERPLRRSTFQRYVSLIRDIPGLVPDIQLLRGTVPGGVVLAITATQRRFELSLGVTNQGSPLLGRVQAQANANVYGLFRTGDITSLTIALPAEVERFQYIALTELQTIGTEGTQLQGNVGYLRTKPEGFTTAGEAKTARLLVSHPFLRSYSANFYATAGIDGLDSTNATLGQTQANEKVRTLRASGAYALSRPATLFSASGVISVGLDALGASVANPDIAESGFVKLNGRAAFTRLVGMEWLMRVNSSAQAGFRNLPVSELFTLGGGEFGRAYPSASILGDSGLAGAAEVAWRPMQFPIGLRGSEIYGFVDGGMTSYRERLGFATQNFDIASAGAGIRLQLQQRTVLQFEAADALATVPGVANAGDWRFGISLRATY